jgi:hypothetical protein
MRWPGITKDHRTKLVPRGHGRIVRWRPQLDVVFVTREPVAVMLVSGVVRRGGKRLCPKVKFHEDEARGRGFWEGRFYLSILL